MFCVELLRVGRHFRFGKNKIIVGRNKQDNERLIMMKKKSDYSFEAKEHMGPTTILQGPKTKKAIQIAGILITIFSIIVGTTFVYAEEFSVQAGVHAEWEIKSVSVEPAAWYRIDI